MRRLVLLSTLAAVPAFAQEALPPPPPPPSVEPAPLPPPPSAAPGARRPGEHRPRSSAVPRKPGTIGEAPVAPAGSQAAPLHPDETLSHWRWLLVGAAAEVRLTSLFGLYGEIDTGAPLSSTAGLPLLLRGGASFRF